MKSLHHTHFLINFVEFPSPPASMVNSDELLNIEHPLRPMVSQFRRLATLLLMMFAGLSVLLWFGMRVIYPQLSPQIDDLSEYTALMPGESTDPEEYSCRLLEHVSGISDADLHKGQTNTYINNSNKPKVVIVVFAYQPKQIVRFCLYSSRLRLVDALRRWGRPDYKERNDITHDWHLTWLRISDTISATCRSLRPEAAVTLLTITRQ